MGGPSLVPGAWALERPGPFLQSTECMYLKQLKRFPSRKQPFSAARADRRREGKKKVLGVFSSEFAWAKPAFGKTSEGRPASGEYVLFKVTVMQILSCMRRPRMDKTGQTGTKVER